MDKRKSVECKDRRGSTPVMDRCVEVMDESKGMDFGWERALGEMDARVRENEGDLETTYVFQGGIVLTKPVGKKGTENRSPGTGE